MTYPSTSSALSPRAKANPFQVQRQIRRSDLSYAAQALLCAILDHDRYGESKCGCIASLETLAQEIGATPSYVCRLLRDLTGQGWIIAEAQHGNARPLRMGITCTRNQRTDGSAPSSDPSSTSDQSEVHVIPFRRAPDSDRPRKESLKRSQRENESAEPPPAQWPVPPDEEIPDYTKRWFANWIAQTREECGQ